MRRTTVIGVSFALICIALPAAGKRPITFEDTMKMQQISDPQISPDGRSIAYVQTTVDFEANKKVGHIWLKPAGGGEPRQLTFGDG